MNRLEELEIIAAATVQIRLYSGALLRVRDVIGNALTLAEAREGVERVLDECAEAARLELHFRGWL